MKTSDYLVTTLEEARKNGFLTKKDFALALTIIANSYAEDDQIGRASCRERV